MFNLFGDSPCTLEHYLTMYSMYQKKFYIDEETEMKWFVVDSRKGFSVFKDENTNSAESKSIFLKWFESKNEAIEWCYHFAVKEIEEIKSKKAISVQIS